MVVLDFILDLLGDVRESRLKLSHRGVLGDSSLLKEIKLTLELFQIGLSGGGCGFCDFRLNFFKMEIFRNSHEKKETDKKKQNCEKYF